MKDTIKNIQEKIEANHPTNTLHVLNGSCMFEYFEQNNLFTDKATYVPFNEAMCWGECDHELFSRSFIEKRAKSLNVLAEDYYTTVLKPLEPLLKEQFACIVLWFGDDMFCQMNSIAILAYLEQNNYAGDVVFCMTMEGIGDMWFEASPLELSGYLDTYHAVMCRHQLPLFETLPVMSQAISLYLTYREEESPITNYIKDNQGKETLMKDLLLRFPEYGLGDIQYQMMIEEHNRC